MNRLLSRLRAFAADRNGGTVIEYGLITALIVIGLIVAVTSMGNSSKAMYDNLDSKWDAATGD